MPKKNKNPLVSICIPLYNCSLYIEETLEKILKQTYKPIEVIVVDDHSTDNSYSLVQKFESDKIKLFRNPKKGGNSARNFAFQQSKGEYIKFMDADDFCSENMISAQLDKMLTEGSELTLIFSPLRMYSSSGFYDPQRTIDKDYVPGIELLIDIWRLDQFNCPHCHLMSRSLVEKTGGWNETILKNQDGEFFARVYTHADKALSVPEEFAAWRQTNVGVSSQISVNALSSFIDTLEIISDILLNYDNTKKMRNICGDYIGDVTYYNYPFSKPLYPKIDALTKKLNTKVRLRTRRKLKWLNICFGWRIAIYLGHKMNL